jgi:hypothetical protein
MILYTPIVASVVTSLMITRQRRPTSGASGIDDVLDIAVWNRRR